MSTPVDPAQSDTAALGLFEAGRRLTAAHGAVFKAFNDADYGITVNQLEELLNGTPGFQSVPKAMQGKVAGLIVGSAMIVVEADRARRANG